jgi:Kef-type K+ transport system membrane component KefB
MLRNATHLGDVLVIIAFGLIFCAVHENAVGVRQLSWFEWFGVTVGVGMILGWVFRWFLEEDRSGNTSFLALVGIVCFASGAAYFLELSPLLVNLVMGLFLARAPSHGEGIKDALARTERPMAIVLLVLAGALWRPSPLIPTLVGFAGFVALRFVTKALGSRVASMGTDLRKDLHRGLLTHGDVAVAMAVSFRLVYEGVAVDVAYAVMLLSFVFHNLIGPRLVRALLVDEGEITRETGAATTESHNERDADAAPAEGEVA